MRDSIPGSIIIRLKWHFPIAIISIGVLITNIGVFFIKMLRRKGDDILLYIIRFLGSILPLFVVFILPPIDQMMQKQVVKNASQIIAAIENYKFKEGHLPETLDDLVPKYLAEIPKPGLARKEINTYIYKPLSPEYKLPSPDGRSQLDFTLLVGWYGGGMYGSAAILYYPPYKNMTSYERSYAYFEVPTPSLWIVNTLEMAIYDEVEQLSENWIYIMSPD
jgi:hypothetical protein